MTEAVDWRDVLSSSVSLELKALKSRVSDRFFVGGLHQNVKAYDNVLESHSLAAAGFGKERTFSNLPVRFRASISK